MDPEKHPLEAPNPPLPDRRAQVLHVGCGAPNPKKLHAVFVPDRWREVRLDIDPKVEPDVLSTMVSMPDVGDASCDAIWSSHNVEHLHDHEVPTAFAEFVRVLKPTGFALITCPNIRAVAQLVADGRLEEPMYEAPSGVVTALDMLYGFRHSIARGNLFMCHNTGFDADRAGRLLLNAGFDQVRVTKGTSY
ncbi:MAG: methyltransferase domain-containing protein, partial [Pseudomonadota bacterium]